MKAITLWQPWATLVAIGAKPYEFRSWAAPNWVVGQRIAIHAGVRQVKAAEVRALLIGLRGREPWWHALSIEPALELLERLRLAPGLAPLGHIVCTCRLGVPVRADSVLGEFGGVVNDSDRDEHFSFAWPLDDVEPLAPPGPRPRRSKLLGVDAMKLALTPTHEIAIVNGCECRVWDGETEDGTPVKALIAAVSPQTGDPERLQAFERDLVEKRQTGRVEIFDLRYLMD